MKKSVIAIIALTSLLAACESHKYESQEPGVRISGEAGIGLKYNGGKTQPVTKTKLTIGLGGSI